MNDYPTPLFPSSDGSAADQDPDHRDPESKFSPKARWIVVGVLIAVVAFGAGGLFAYTTNSDTSNSALPSTTPATPSVVTSTAATLSTAGATPSTTTPITTIPAIPVVPTFDQIDDFVHTLYGSLPSNTEFGWTRFDAHYSDQFSKQSYEDFWSTIKGVTVVSVTPQDASTVVVRLTYTTQTGSSDTEDRSMSVIEKQGQLYVFDSHRIGSV